MTVAADRGQHDEARQQLARHIAELEQLTPALRQAVQRDHTPAAGQRVTIGGTTLTLPVNLDVLRALDQVPTGNLDRYLALYEQALSTGDQTAARRITRDVDHWRRLTKLALGLLHYDRPLGQPCPQHDEPLTELVALGDEGWLRHDRHGHFVTWTRDQRVWCRHCGTVWDHRQMLLLGRLLKWAAQRRTAAATNDEEDDDDGED